MSEVSIKIENKKLIRYNILCDYYEFKANFRINQMEG